MKTIRTVLLASGAALLLSTGIAAAAPGTERTHLNVRSGPGTNYPVVGALQSGETVDVQGCTGCWCQVNFSGGSGFASCSRLAMAGGPGIGVTVTQGYAPGYAYEDYPGYGYDDDYYDYGPSVGFAFGGRFHRGHRFDHRWDGRTGAWQGRPGGWQGARTGAATGTWQGARTGAATGTWQGNRSGFAGNRVGGAAPGSVTPMGRGGPSVSAPTGLSGGAAVRGGGGFAGGGGGAAAGGGAHVGGGGGGGAGAGGGAGGAVHR